MIPGPCALQLSPEYTYFSVQSPRQTKPLRRGCSANKHFPCMDRLTLFPRFLKFTDLEPQNSQLILPLLVAVMHVHLQDLSHVLSALLVVCINHDQQLLSMQWMCATVQCASWLDCSLECNMACIQDGMQTLKPPTRSFSEWPAWLDQQLPHLAGKRVLMYCTGGVPCTAAVCAPCKNRAFGMIGMYLLFCP